MSKATKRKHVTKEVLEDYVLPEANQSVVQVVGGRGNNLHEVLTETGVKYLVSMPTKFRKNVWIKRGDYVLIDPIEEGDKVKGEIVTILYKDQIKYIKAEGLWPKEFESGEVAEPDQMIPDDMLPPSDDSDYDEGDLVVNANRRNVYYEESSDESDEEEAADKGDDGPNNGGSVEK
ncbi:probable RNA-binding protein EIF1AD [Lineus longissimus]|uniref:probable RNA-binding protein EIF1AD n=1 Tax=Lineus longissimus TaxID=88925 RepID=UPI002B4F980D